MSGHTPGPWRTAATDDTLVLAGGAIQIASAYDRCGDIEETDANARLIAAAPDLLAALLLLDKHGHTEAVWQQARAALARATSPESFAR